MSILGASEGLAGGQGGTSGNAALDLIGGLIQKSGGVGGLVSTLQSGGLSSLVESWVGNGANQPVSGQQLGQALAGTAAGQHVQAMAQQMGVDPAQMFDQLAQHLPAAVNHMTPNGQVTENSGGFNLGELSGLASQLGL
ncbi:MAG TPA: YidB family protein [Rhodanobacteraceae bacterium]